MITTTVDLLRHGESGSSDVLHGSTDIPLTPKGWQQMAQAAAQTGGWQAIVSSPLQRCYAFADRLSKKKACSIACLRCTA